MARVTSPVLCWVAPDFRACKQLPVSYQSECTPTVHDNHHSTRAQHPLQPFWTSPPSFFSCEKMSTCNRHWLPSNRRWIPPIIVGYSFATLQLQRGPGSGPRRGALQCRAQQCAAATARRGLLHGPGPEAPVQALSLEDVGHHRPLAGPPPLLGSPPSQHMVLCWVVLLGNSESDEVGDPNHSCTRKQT
jgi:hypothetical protein